MASVAVGTEPGSGDTETPTPATGVPAADRTETRMVPSVSTLTLVDGAITVSEVTGCPIILGQLTSTRMRL